MASLGGGLMSANGRRGAVAATVVQPSNMSSGVSVIMIFLNAAAYLDEAIRSVLAQTHERWELLLVDDGSTDASTDIARRYAAEQPRRIRYLEHDGHRNLGMSASRNRGLLEARYPYVAFLDSDDVWLPARLERHVHILDAHPGVSMVYGPTLYWFGWTGNPEDVARDEVGDLWLEPEQVIRPPTLLRLYLETGGGALPGICSLLARRHVVLRLGGFETTFRGTYEDQVFLAKMSLHEPIYMTGECLDRYRQHAESCCQQAIRTGEYDPGRPHPGRERYMTWLESYLDERGVEDRVIRRAVRRELSPYRHPVRFRAREWWRSARSKR